MQLLNNFTGRKRMEISNVFLYWSAACRMARALEKVWGLATPRTPPAMKRINVEVWSLTLSYITQTWLVGHKQIVVERLVYFFSSAADPLKLQVLLALVDFIYKKITMVQVLRCVSKKSLKYIRFKLMYYLESESKWRTRLFVLHM